jgi:thioredoxin reductase (NADPH)
MRAMGPPVVLATDGDTEALDAVERELSERYSRHYRVVCLRSLDEALAQLEAFADAGEEVALVLAGRGPEGMTVSDLLDAAGHLHPHARRGLLIEWAEWGRKETGHAILEGMADGRFDNFVIRPAQSPDEQFHQMISTMLLDWAETNRAAPYTVRVVGETWDGRAYELREALQQCAVVHRFCLADSSEGRAIVAEAPDDAELPLLVLPDGTILQNPTNTEIAVAAGGPVAPASMDFDLLIVGAGPAGLSAAVYGASEGLATLVVDRGGVGGQATSSSLIRNYLGFPGGISGRRLAQQAYNQAWIFGSDFTFMHTVTGLTPEDGHLLVTLSESDEPIRAGAVLLTMGATYRRLGIPALEALNGAGVYYGGPISEAPGLTGRDVFVVGGANSAGQAALHLARWARRVTLVVRAGSLRTGMSDYLVRHVETTANIDVRLRTEVVGGGGAGRLDHLVLRDTASHAETTVDAQALFLLIGARPATEWLPPAVARDDYGFVLTGPDVTSDHGWSLERSPFLLETSMPGVFAAGDVRHGAVKRVASAVGEGSIAVQLMHQYFALDDTC